MCSMTWTIGIRSEVTDCLRSWISNSSQWIPFIMWFCRSLTHWHTYHSETSVLHQSLWFRFRTRNNIWSLTLLGFQRCPATVLIGFHILSCFLFQRGHCVFESIFSVLNAELINVRVTQSSYLKTHSAQKLSSSLSNTPLLRAQPSYLDRPDCSTEQFSAFFLDACLPSTTINSGEWLYKLFFLKVNTVTSVLSVVGQDICIKIFMLAFSFVFCNKNNVYTTQSSAQIVYLSISQLCATMRLAMSANFITGSVSCMWIQCTFSQSVCSIHLH